MGLLLHIYNRKISFFRHQQLILLASSTSAGRGSHRPLLAAPFARRAATHTMALSQVTCGISSVLCFAISGDCAEVQQTLVLFLLFGMLMQQQ